MCWTLLIFLTAMGTREPAGKVTNCQDVHRDRAPKEAGLELRNSANGQRRAAADYSERLGERLRQLRKQHGLTQRDVAEKLGVSTPALCRWETGQTLPRKSNIHAFAEAFDLSEADLLSGLADNAAPISSPVPKQRHPARRADDVPAMSRDSLGKLLSACKQRIAEAAGTSPERVKIVIEV